VAWSMQAEGVPPAGAIADSGVVNTQWERAQFEQGTCGDDGRSPGALARHLGTAPPRADTAGARARPARRTA
jgi:hypothetical protein